MNKKIIIGMFIFTFLLILGCSNTELDKINEENEQLTSEIFQLKEIIAEKDKEISYLEEVYSKKINELAEATNTIKMVRESAMTRLVDYDQSFYYLKEIYKVHSDHEIKDDWYIINDEKFQIELLGYESAKKVNFYTIRMGSDEGINLLFTDTEASDGWIYTNEQISKIINKHQFHKSYTFEPYFVLYTEVTLEDGSVLKTTNLPIYYK